MSSNYTNRESEDCFYNFDSFVDPSMLLPEDVSLDSLCANDFEVMQSIPALPAEIPVVNQHQQSQPSSPGKGPGSLYEKLTNPTSICNSTGTCIGAGMSINSPSVIPGSPTMMMSPIPGSPTLYPYGSPYSMGSPSSLMMTSNLNDASWMHSSRPRRRRSTYASPTMMTQTPASPYLGSFGYMPQSPMMNAFPHASYMMAPAMSPMNVTVKLPMVPLTPTSQHSVSRSMKIPLVLPCHLQQEQTQNTVAPNVSKLQTCSSASVVSSQVPSRCSSIAPNSSISSRSQRQQQNWFTEMSATKDRFLKDVEGIDLTNVTVLELKQILRRFGLNSTGKKAQLVDRITEISDYLKTEGRKRVKVDKETEKNEVEISEAEIETVISRVTTSSISAAV